MLVLFLGARVCLLAVIPVMHLICSNSFLIIFYQAGITGMFLILMVMVSGFLYDKIKIKIKIKPNNIQKPDRIFILFKWYTIRISKIWKEIPIQEIKIQDIRNPNPISPRGR